MDADAALFLGCDEAPFLSIDTHPDLPLHAATIDRMDSSERETRDLASRHLGKRPADFIGTLWRIDSVHGVEMASGGDGCASWQWLA